MKTILVTGATSGFGAAFTRRFIRDGHRVIATGRRQSLLADLAAECGKHICTYPLDVTDLDCVDSLLTALPKEWRKIDVLVNNAGAALGGINPAWQASVADWDKMIATNISGLVHLTRVILPQMVERNEGQIINIGSTAGHYAY